MKDKLKELLIAIVLIVGIVFLLNIGSNMDKEFIDNCVAGGNSLTFCQNAVDGR